MSEDSETLPNGDAHYQRIRSSLESIAALKSQIQAYRDTEDRENANMCEDSLEEADNDLFGALDDLAYRQLPAPQSEKLSDQTRLKLRSLYSILEEIWAAQSTYDEMGQQFDESLDALTSELQSYALGAEAPQWKPENHTPQSQLYGPVDKAAAYALLKDVDNRFPAPNVPEEAFAYRLKLQDMGVQAIAIAMNDKPVGDDLNEDLYLEVGDSVTNIRMGDVEQEWYGQNERGDEGYFPASCVELLVEEEMATEGNGEHTMADADIEDAPAEAAHDTSVGARTGGDVDDSTNGFDVGDLPKLAYVVEDYCPSDDDELEIIKDAMVRVTMLGDDGEAIDGWLYACDEYGCRGWIPAIYVKIMQEDTQDDEMD